MRREGECCSLAHDQSVRFPEEAARIRLQASEHARFFLEPSGSEGDRACKSILLHARRMGTRLRYGR